MGRQCWCKEGELGVVKGLVGGLGLVRAGTKSWQLPVLGLGKGFGGNRELQAAPED